MFGALVASVGLEIAFHDADGNLCYRAFGILQELYLAAASGHNNLLWPARPGSTAAAMNPKPSRQRDGRRPVRKMR